MRRIGLLGALVLAACAAPAPPEPVAFAAALQVDVEALVSTPSGLRYRDLREGSGPAATSGRRVEILYGVFLADGTQVDANLDRQSPDAFTVGSGAMIRGLDETVRGMRAGGIRQAVVPSRLGYGRRGREGVPPGATLVFVVEVVSVR